MIKGDTFTLFDHVMEVQLRKESLNLVRYDAICTCCTYPRNLIMEGTEETLNKMKEASDQIETPVDT
jgi:hypothetical protein